MDDAKDYLKGLGGWLILVGIGVVINPIRDAFDIFSLYQSTFYDGTWQLLTSEASNYYVPYHGAVSIFYLVASLLLLFASIYMVTLFFRKHKWFPGLFIGISLCWFALLISSFGITAWVYGDEIVWDRTCLLYTSPSPRD